MSTKTLLEKIGGEELLDTAVDLFYNRVTVDPELVRFFEGHDINRLRAH